MYTVATKKVEKKTNVEEEMSVEKTENVQSKQRLPIWFEWLQLLATFCVPITIGIFTLMNNYQQITLTKTQYETGVENRQTDLKIAADNRQKDLQLADDQQKENILVEYQNYLAVLLLSYQLRTNASSETCHVARFKTLSALRQLDSQRKTYLIQDLFDTDLITTSEKRDLPIISLAAADLTNLTLGISSNSNCQKRFEVECYKEYFFINFRESDLTKATLTNLIINGASFQSAIMTDVDMSYTKWQNEQIVVDQSMTISFENAKLIRTLFFASRYELSPYNDLFPEPLIKTANFYLAQFIESNLTDFKCSSCRFNYASFTKTIIRYSKFDAPLYDGLYDIKENFQFTIFNNVIIHETEFNHVDFFRAKFDRTNISYTNFTDSIFSGCNIINAILYRTIFKQSVFYEVANFGFKHTVNFTNSVLDKTVFFDSDLRQCIMFNTSLIDTHFIRTNLTGCEITDEQLFKAKLLHGTTLPNGTRIS
jgi:uncharacterized protein YjbI with pentapeptide repeats